MLFIKSTLRRKTSKIYIILLSILMTIIFILFEFNHYFENETQNSYDKNAFYLMYSKEDLENDLLKYEEIKNVKTGIFLEF